MRTTLLFASALVLAACSGAAPEGAAVPPPAAATAPPSKAPASLPPGAAESRGPAAGAPPPRDVAAADPSMAIHAELLRAVGTAACSDDAQCRVLPLGSKPCGGPEGHLAWSVVNTDARQIEALALRYQQARQARNQRLGLVSDCAMVPEPAVRCERVAGSAAPGGQCRTLPGRGGPTLLTR